jgi:phenylalanyl-tRNA synthetase beta chain
MGNDATGVMDFFDIKGVVEGLLKGLHIDNATYARADHPSFHPGRSAKLVINGKDIGTFGELHPLVARAGGITDAPVMIAEFDLDALLSHAQRDHQIRSLPVTPAILEDIALVVPLDLPSAEVEAVIRQAGGDLLKDVRLFDVYQGDSIAAGHKSLAFSLVYQTDERTLKDKDVAKLRKKIIGAAENRLGAKLRA